jgi:hypothetical protein
MKSSNKNSKKICPAGADLSHAEGLTDEDITKLIIAFQKFSNAPKKKYANAFLYHPVFIEGN